MPNTEGVIQNLRLDDDMEAPSSASKLVLTLEQLSQAIQAVVVTALRQL